MVKPLFVRDLNNGKHRLDYHVCLSVEDPVYRILFNGLSVHRAVWEVGMRYFDFIAIDFIAAKKKEGRKSKTALLPYLQNRSVYSVKLDCLVIDLCSWLAMSVSVWLQSPVTILWLLTPHILMKGWKDISPNSQSGSKTWLHVESERLYLASLFSSLSTLVLSTHWLTHPPAGPLTTEELRSYLQFNPHVLGQSLKYHVLQNYCQTGVLRTQCRENWCRRLFPP